MLDLDIHTAFEDRDMLLTAMKTIAAKSNYDARSMRGVWLYYFENMTYAAVAVEIGSCLLTASCTVKRGVKRIRRQLQLDNTSAVNRRYHYTQLQTTPLTPHLG